jgi:hypothetical protein
MVLALGLGLVVGSPTLAADSKSRHSGKSSNHSSRSSQSSHSSSASSHVSSVDPTSGVQDTGVPVGQSGNSASSMGQAKAMSLDTKPGPAHRTVQGKVVKVDGQVYVMEDYEGREIRMFVSQQTKKFRGDKKPGDSIRAELTYGGHANYVQ